MKRFFPQDIVFFIQRGRKREMKIIKRNGAEATFDISKIIMARSEEHTSELQSR